MNKTLFLFACMLSVCGITYSQKVDTTVINGEQYFVYPFKINVTAHREYNLAASVKETMEYTYKRYKRDIQEEFGEDTDLKEFKKLFKEIDKMQQQDKKKYLNGKFKKVVRKNPYPLLEQQYTFDNDLVPSLDPIPDGKYVQYFEPFCLINERGKCVDQDNFIAAYFSIKNNILEGEAVWLNIKGDTLKHGFFLNGLKEGEWELIQRKVDYYIDIESAENYVKRGYPNIDTNRVIANFEKGAMNGRYREWNNSEFPTDEGFYKNNQPSGEWLYREVGFIGKGNNRKRNRYNELVTSRFLCADPLKDTLISKKPIIRNGLLDLYNRDFIFDFIPRYSLMAIPSNMFEINFAKETDLELEEEKVNAYDNYGAVNEYGEYGEYDYGYDYQFSQYQATVYDAERKESLKRGYVIDSIGMRVVYLEVEAFYPNGEKAYGYYTKNGDLIAEDTVFWDNGIAHDIVTFIADSNQYLRTIFDYQGRLFKSIQYDSLGDFNKVLFEGDPQKFVILDGLKATDPEYGDMYDYFKFDTLSFDLEESLVLSRGWYKMDSSLVNTAIYDPVERKLDGAYYAITGKPTSVSHKTFAEDFKSWNGKDSSFVGPLTQIISQSASLYEGDYFADSVPQNNVGYAYNRFDVASEYVLLKEGEKYTGEVEILFDKSKFHISKNNLTLQLPKLTKRYKNRTYRKMSKFRKKGSGRNSILLNNLASNEWSVDLGSEFYRYIIDPMTGHVFNELGRTYPLDDYGGEYGNTTFMKEGVMTKLKGYMLDGKAQGDWIAFDARGNILTKANFDRGETNGTVQNFAYAYPKVEGDYYWEESPIADSFPAKRTYYLLSTEEYKNGLLEGKSINYNWLGEIQRTDMWKEGYLNGPAIERNKLACTKMNYLDNVLDGYVRTYLTLESEDSLLLYDLNFQNGLLQGESKAYHLNGLIAKRGFFLNGDPIEDYEAYDSLGFKYHYVKFKYSFPVEEKIWEENELSVRYLFDWQDSIYFEPSDITTSHSLEAMLFDLGFGQDYLERPYYGRPSLVEKNGIKYHMTKYYPNDQESRDGEIDDGRKSGCWRYFSYEGELLYEVDYFDSILVLNDSIKFKSKGKLTDFDAAGNKLYESYVIEKFEKYDCSHADHYEIRQLYTIWEANDSTGRMNGYVKNYYDNGTIQSEGQMKEGLPNGFWKIYDPFGKLNQYGQYISGKRDGRWLSGDLSKTKYLGDICLNPNMPDLSEEMEHRENLLDIIITSYSLGKTLNKQYYDINMNRFKELEEEAANEE